MIYPESAIQRHPREEKSSCFVLELRSLLFFFCGAGAAQPTQEHISHKYSGFLDRHLKVAGSKNPNCEYQSAALGRILENTIMNAKRYGSCTKSDCYSSPPACRNAPFLTWFFSRRCRPLPSSAGSASPDETAKKLETT